MSNQITRHKEELVGLGRFELPTSPLSGVRSNQLSYRPNRLGQPVTLVARLQTFSPSIAESSNSCGCLKRGDLSIKEVIQPQVPLRLPRSEEHTSELQSRPHL